MRPIDRPNVLVTGTPGTGKTTLAEMLAHATGLRHLEVGRLIKERECVESYDAEFDTHVLDEDKLLDEMEPIMQEAGVVADYHCSELFPERWFDLVIVLTTDNAVLYSRLEARHYSEKKISENIECEIMQVPLEEARSSYPQEIVIELQSNTVDDMEQNVERFQQWYHRRTNPDIDLTAAR